MHFRLTLRGLLKRPAFTLSAIGALALGIGANTAIFSIINGLLLNPAGVRNAQRVVALRVKYDKLNLKDINTSLTDFADVRDSHDIFASAAVASPADYNYLAGGVPERLMGAQVTWQWFAVFGSRPILGRDFRADDDQPNTNRSVILSYRAWRRLFGGDAAVIGRKMLLNDEPHTVIGVADRNFRWPNQADIFVPLGLPAKDFGPDNRTNESFIGFARLRDGIDDARAATYVRELLTDRAIRNEDSGGYLRASGWGMFIKPFNEFVGGDVRTRLLMLLGAVGMVLLIACANIAGLMLARASTQSRELAVRAALGAGRWRLMQPVIAEALLLAAGGAIAAIFVAITATSVILAMAPEDTFVPMLAQIDGRVLAFTAAVAALAALLFGVLPAWQVARHGSYGSLKEGGRGGTASAVRQRARSVLVVGEVALAVVLLAGAGLLLHSMAQLQQARLGFDPHGVASAQVSLPEQRYGLEDKRAAFYRDVTDRLAGISGVTAAGAGTPLPFSGENWSASFAIESRPNLPGDPGPHGDVRYVTPGYFAALRIPLLRGRYFTEEDQKTSEPIAVVDDVLARQYWPNGDAVGGRIRRGSRDTWARVVGIVGHVKQTDVASDSGKGTYYFDLYQKPVEQSAFVLRNNGDAGSLLNAIRSTVQSVDSAQPVYDAKTMDQRVDFALAPQRLVVTLLGAFAAIALFLSALGLYGIISYTVAQRTQEIGVRMALGARSSEVQRSVVGQGMQLALAGVVAGSLIAWVLARSLPSLLYEVRASDPISFVATVIMLIAVAVFASWLPARAAARVDPATALRYE